jgi:hypothetical protein
MPESIIAVEHGRLFVAAVPHVAGKMSLALRETPLTLAPLGTYVLRILVPNVFG